MPHQLDSITRIRICWSLYQNGISPEEIPEQLNINRSTVYRWIKGIKLKGIVKFIRDYKKAKKGRKQPRKTDIITKLHNGRRFTHRCRRVFCLYRRWGFSHRADNYLPHKRQKVFRFQKGGFGIMSDVAFLLGGLKLLTAEPFCLTEKRVSGLSANSAVEDV